MKKYILLVSTLLFITFHGNTQPIPGLLGKRLTIFYNLDFFYNTLTFKHDAAEKDLLQANAPVSAPWTYLIQLNKHVTYQHTLQFDYVINREASLGISVSYFKNGYGTFNSLNLSNNVNAILYSKNIISRGISLHYKKFTDKGLVLAPLGYYRQYSIHFNTVKDYWQQNSSLFKSPQTILERDLVMPAITFTLGKQTIAYKYLLLNLGIEMGAILPLSSQSSPLPYIEDNLSSLYSNLILADIQTPWQRMGLFYSFRFKLGIGLATF